VRPAGAAEDTARLDDDARHARRWPLDRQTQGCVADETNRKVAGSGVSAGAGRVDPSARHQPVTARALARVSKVHLRQIHTPSAVGRWPLAMR
jgi:hypothetical protein